jgi:hypothetical protein
MRAISVWPYCGTYHHPNAAPGWLDPHTQEQMLQEGRTPVTTLHVGSYEKRTLQCPDHITYEQKGLLAQGMEAQVCPTLRGHQAPSLTA